MGLDAFSLPAEVTTSQRRVADVIADWLVTQGVRLAFGVSGGGIAPMWHALAHTSAVRTIHTAHESGAAFAATEASLTTGRPVVVFTTTGPGLTNALTGLIAARQEGARVLVLSGATPSARRLRGATQDTHEGAPLHGLFTAGPLFDEATLVVSPDLLAPALQRASEVLARPGGGVVHLGLPTDVQGLRLTATTTPLVQVAPQRVDDATLDAVAELRDRDVCVVVGFGARHAAAEVRALCERTGWRAVSTPRGKGVLPESHPACLGVVGFAGQPQAEQALSARRPEVLLALGTSLGEASSGWSDALRPARLVVEVGSRGEPLGGAYPHTALLSVHSEVRPFLEALLTRIPDAPAVALVPHRSDADPPRLHGPVRPRHLFDAVQRVVVEGSDALVYAESGNAFGWAIHHLRLSTPRLRVSVGWGSMGHVTCGAIGAATTGRRVVALVGDGAMLMGNELATAAREGLPVTWVVLNDGQYGMCQHGMSALGLSGIDARLASVDFGALARALGVYAETVSQEAGVDDALRRASDQPGPALLDVRIDRDERGPIGRRVQALTWHAEAG